MSDFGELIEELETRRRALLRGAEAANEVSDYDTKWQLEAQAEGIEIAIGECRKREQ